MNELTTAAIIVGILTSAIRLATPYLYAGIGEAITELSGVVNLGVDGIMLMSAFAAFFVSLNTGNLWLGLAAGMVVGLLMGLLMAFVSVTLKAEQGISGIGLYMFGLGLSSLLFKTTIGTVKTIEGFQSIKIPVLGDIPFLGEIFFQQSLPVYGAFLLVPLAWFILDKTTWGLKLKAVGQTPAAADSLGVNVDLVRYVATCLGAMLAGIAGASLSARPCRWRWSTCFRKTSPQVRASSRSRWCTLAAGGRWASCWARCSSASSMRSSCGCRS